jgi:hypothetical protein
MNRWRSKFCRTFDGIATIRRVADESPKLVQKRRNYPAVYPERSEVPGVFARKILGLLGMTTYFIEQLQRFEHSQIRILYYGVVL